MEKDKDKAELYIEYLEDNVRELVVNFSENDSELSAALVQKGEIIVKTKLYLSIDNPILLQARPCWIFLRLQNPTWDSWT